MSSTPHKYRSIYMPLHLMGVAVIFALTLIISLPASGAQDNKPASYNNIPNIPLIDGKGCLQVADLNVADLKRSPSVSRIKKHTPLPDKKLLRPAKEKEIRSMIRAMEPVRLKGGDGWTLRAVAKGDKLNLDRMGVILSDALTMLAIIQGKEVLNRFKKIPGVGKEELVFMEQGYKSLQFCAETRFEEWGGEPAYLESIRIVEILRPELESLLLKNIELGTSPQSGGWR